MEYRTTHGKVLARMERKKNERERKKTKGRFIVSQPLDYRSCYVRIFVPASFMYHSFILKGKDSGLDWTQ